MADKVTLEQRLRSILKFYEETPLAENIPFSYSTIVIMLEYLENTSAGDLLSDGSIPMVDGYIPVEDLDIATKKFVEAQLSAGGDLESDGSVPMQTIDTPILSYMDFWDTDSSFGTVVGYIPKVGITVLIQGSGYPDVYRKVINVEQILPSPATTIYLDAAVPDYNNYTEYAASSYVPRIDQDIATKKYVDENASTPPDLTPYVKKDGSTPFTAAQEGVVPTDDAHLSTKKYVDDSKPDVTPFVKKDGSTPFTATQEGVEPTADTHLATKKYVDDSVPAPQNLQNVTNVGNTTTNPLKVEVGNNHTEVTELGLDLHNALLTATASIRGDLISADVVLEVPNKSGTHTIATTEDIHTEYDSVSDTYKLKETVDGQVQNLGQEIFETVINATADTATTTEPKVWIIGSVSTPPFFNTAKVGAGGLSQNALFGLNTTAIGGLGSTGKIVTYGRVKLVNTSAWAVNTRLYAGTVPGEMTAVKPAINIYHVGTVKVSDATNGEIFVNTVGASREDVQVTPVSSLRGYFSGNLAASPAGAFYVTDNDASVGANVSQVIEAPQNGTAWIAVDTVGVNQDGETVSVGQLTAQIEFSINNASGGEQLIMEVYKASSAGNPIAAGTGLPNGDLGVAPIVVLTSPIVSFDNNVTKFIELAGYVYTEVALNSGQRLRFHIGASKIGGNGQDKDFTIYQGASHETYAEQPLSIQAEDVSYNNTASTLNAVTVQQMGDELDSKKANLNTENIFTEIQAVQGISKAWTILDDDGSRVGALAASSYAEYDAVVGGVDDDLNLLNTGVVGNNVMLGTDNLYVASNGAVPFGYLKLGSTGIVSADGKTYYPVQFQTLETVLHEESFTDTSNIDISSGADFTIITTTGLVNNYTPSGDFNSGFSIQELSGKSTGFEFWVEVDNVQIGVTREGVVGADSVLKELDGGGLPSNVNAGSVISIHVRALDTGAGRTTLIRGDLTDTTLTIRELGYGTQAASTNANHNTVIANNDADAASQGVEVGGYYAKPNGTLKVRLT